MAKEGRIQRYVEEMVDGFNCWGSCNFILTEKLKILKAKLKFGTKTFLVIW